MIVFLGPPDSPVFAFLQEAGGGVRATQEKVDVGALRSWNADFIVSHGYRHLIRPDVIAAFSPAIINLHIAFLPWNRGADPNLWSFLEDTPKGVTIHVVDEGLDTGPILCRRPVTFPADATLRTTYEMLQQQLLVLFRESWDDIRQCRLMPVPQERGGSVHRLKDKGPYLYLLSEQGWDTPVEKLTKKAL